MKLIAATLAAAWATTAHALPSLPVAARQDSLTGSCPTSCDAKALGTALSKCAKVYYPGSSEFTRATTRWSVLATPQPQVVVIPCTEQDVAETYVGGGVKVKFANKKNVPFLAYNTAHGALTTLGAMDSGVEIFLENLSSVQVSADGKTATIGGGTMSKKVTDTLWAAGKQTVTGTCECVSYMGPALGGGHGWLQGHHGLISDQWVSLRVVLADGSIKTINRDSDLWWAMQGAGHNFGIVTSATVNIYDIVHSDWAVETLIFSGEKVEEVYAAVNEHLLKDGTQPVDIINWSYWLNNPDADPNNPIILFWILQEGVSVVDPIYSKPFYDIGPIVGTPTAGDYRDLAGWTGIDLAAGPCQKAGTINPRFPLYVEKYNITAQREAYDLFASKVSGTSPFSGSLFLFEGYSLQGVKAIDDKSTAYAFRGDNLLTAPLITYAPGGDALNAEAEALGNELRNIIHRGSGAANKAVYVNYAYGNENPKEWYGSDSWRQDKLKALKTKYDPKGKFSFYAPIA
ncbi:probable FAD-dependent oxygenase [Cephalotrichum gorgonifer]|uniref:Probable FAD-dependent oxygenase n=1 Tax=Cephalotrichum gorgonifer TaxID=2041049 RepID=A0AAE8N299_9PEZI|nr:probable FAD-dependent oxygenase [Cephalotrichum gorgonifer]